MKRFIKFIIFSILVVTMAFSIFKFSNSYSLNIMYKDIDWSINTKGCTDARAFDFDKDNNLYVAFKDTVKVIKSNSKEREIIKEDNFNIYDIACYKDKIIIATDNRIVEYDPEIGNYIDLITDIPNEGVNKEVKLLVKDDQVYITIGSNTNSGVVEDEYGVPDTVASEIISSGVVYGNNSTGGFSNYGSYVKQGEKIEGVSISNGSILKYDLNKKQYKTYVTGLRNVTGLDVDGNGNLIAIVGGMEDKGVRPIKNDSDYIYILEENNWYGWPDFSGGDPVTSKRFVDEGNANKFLILNHQTEIPQGPLYQHTSVSNLKGLAIDSEGNFLKKDTAIFADNSDNYLYGLSKEGVASIIVELGDNSYIEEIKCVGNAIYVLDSKCGNIYKLQVKGISNLFNLPKVVWLFLIVFIVVIIMAILYKFKSKEKSK